MLGSCRLPVGVPFTKIPGAMAIQAAPTSFFIPVEIPIIVGKDLMIADQSFTQTRGKVKAKGTYNLHIKLCNPGC